MVVPKFMNPSFAEFDLVADIGNFNMEAKDELDGDVNNSDDIE